MMGLNKEFIKKYNNMGVILSPRSCTREQVEKHAAEIKNLGGTVLFDPQFYEPRTSHEKLLGYPYWEEISFETSEFTISDQKELCKKVIDYQVNILKVKEVILPGRYSNVLSESWLEMQASFADYSSELSLGLPVYSTLAIGSDIVGESEMFDRIIDELVSFPVDGVYVVLRSPGDKFLVNDETYLYNVLDGLLSLCLAGKRIIVGYANQQSLIYSAAGISGIASGNFRNVRSFNPEIFDIQDEDTHITRATWYYDANTLSEFRPQQLSLAYRRGLSKHFGPSCDYCKQLLKSPNPALVPWKEPSAFRHYLYELRRQWLEIDKVEPGNRIQFVKDMLYAASHRLEYLEENGFRPGQRAFSKYFDPTIGAVEAFEIDRSEDIRMLRK
ncbi:hypothetical protein Dred_0787 [Desulforamulus reducens MI-1]|uniref:Uncharacterized protein n=1 Tax=Desulforamulus reducens (strain ATCC BAA-1160 / DSM 100696 / MI-1) TaxID=349161 RepID=A4J2M2_DESRM|nr:hypothetical protein [Desulforamulus reducens]ABO49325.1 hypothetical protein Dred_0787 [Desulforamulus reducens MI-1]